MVFVVKVGAAVTGVVRDSETGAIVPEESVGGKRNLPDVGTPGRSRKPKGFDALRQAGAAGRYLLISAG
jgi:hypothetical protein